MKILEKINKNKFIWIPSAIAAAGIGTFLVVEYISKKRLAAANAAAVTNPTSIDNTPSSAFNTIKSSGVYGADLLNCAERVYRLESGNFTSSIYQKTLGAGEIATNGSSPFGWGGLVAFWTANVEYAATGTYLSINGNKYLIFPTLKIGIMNLCEILKSYKSQNLGVSHYNPSDSNYLSKIESFPDSQLITPSVSNNQYIF